MRVIRHIFGLRNLIMMTSQYLVKKILILYSDCTRRYVIPVNRQLMSGTDRKRHPAHHVTLTVANVNCLSELADNSPNIDSPLEINGILKKIF